MVIFFQFRSTELDQKWTWEQLRSMQVGGNANAKAFFRSHGCSSNDIQTKYNSRAAVLYRGKLKTLTSEVMRKYDKSVSTVGFILTKPQELTIWKCMVVMNLTPIF